MLPRTPSKADDKIKSITDSLAANWNLQFPAWDATYSPSTVRDPSRVEEQVMSRLRFLIFKDPDGLAVACERFEKHAETIQAETVQSQWKHKPRADSDLLPRRLHAEISFQRDPLLRRPQVSEATAGQLMKTLLHCLDLAADHAKQTQQSPSSKIYGDAGNIAKFEEPRPTTPESRKKQVRLDRFLTSNTLLPPSRHVEQSHVPGQHPSSDEFDPFVEVSGAMAHDPTAETPRFGTNDLPEAEESPVQEEETFATPPSTPPHLKEASYDAYSLQLPDPVSLPLLAPTTPSHLKPVNPEAYFLRQPDPVFPQLSSLGKKRSCEEPMKPPLARKITRGRDEGQNLEAPNSKSIPIAIPQERRTIPTALHPSHSFESATSFGTSTVTTSSASWTPNTSFYTSSIPTSLNSPVDTTDKSDNFMHDRPSLTTRPEVKSMEVERFLDAVNDVREYESMDIDDSDTALLQRANSVGLSPTKGALANTTERGKVSYRKEDEYSAEQFVSLSLLAPLSSAKRCAVPFRQLYEVTRVSMFTKLPLDVFSTCLDHTEQGYDSLWSSLRSIVRAHEKSLPEKSSLTAWERASNTYDGVSLTGDLKYAEQPEGPIFEFRLNAMKVERSYRLARKFGGDRFCVVGLPGVSHRNLPGYLKQNHSVVRQSIIKLLVDTDFCFLGRIWRAFYLKPSNKKTRRGKKIDFNEPNFQIYFFAQDGHDFGSQPLTGEVDPRGNLHSPMSIEKLVDWFMPAKYNTGQTCLKFFTRLALGVSNTTPTVVFHSNEIIRTRDARKQNPGVRRVSSNREYGKIPTLSNPEDCIMNDGCARISKAAALEITDILRLDQTPSVFQGRIAGAKGVWMVDILDESVPQCNRDFWIEITDSQQKFEGQLIESYNPDVEQVTFEVHSYSKKLSPAALNFQLMPILANQGVPEEVFSLLLKEDLMEKVGVLELAMDGGLALGKWNQENNPVTGERAFRKKIEMLGGIPNSTAERISWFVEHGFEPKSCRELKDVLFKAIKEWCLNLENKMNIAVGKSTSALMIADPLGVLEPNEIHLCFSSKFRDPKSRWEDVMLHDTDVLVARLPALLPSDIQKVRAVFKTELRRYTDVVIFSSKGSCSLADKLSGGDYDGDRAWICWEPSIVDPFRNASTPESPPSLEFYGIEKDTVKVSDLQPLPDFTSAFLRHAFRFNLQPDMLGSCTFYHESLCYSRTTIDDPKAVSIGVLLGLLVDRAKAGLIFDENKWHFFLKKFDLPLWLPKPAYKDREKARPTNHMIDKLVFVDAKRVREKTLGDFAQHFTLINSWDEDLVRICNSERELTKKDQVLAKVLDDLDKRLAEIVDYWRDNVRFINEGEFQSMRKSTALPFAAVVEKCRADFLAINPCNVSGVDNFHVVRRWNLESGGGNFGAKYWGWLKASVLFQKYHERGVVWYVAGLELGEMKAMARGTETYRVVRREVHHAMKLNGKLVDNFKRDRALEAEEAGEEEEDEYGAWGWDE